MAGKEKLFYSFVERDGYKGNAPTYFDPKDFAWSQAVMNNTEQIKTELLQFLKDNKELWPYFDQNIVSKKNSWKTIPFSAWGVQFRKNQNAAPITTKTLNAIPGIVSSSFNMLDANAEILPHYGDTDGVMRCHLGLIVPGELPEVGFEVENEQKSWEEGKLIFFCDAHHHRAWNNSDKQRFILLFDVIRPEYLSRQRTICSKVLASLFLQSLAVKLPFLHKTPKVFQFTLYQISILGARIVVPVRNFFSKLFVN
jgi:aspartyl/asparaginyl beta-hydroxylase (cupin superfamily)